jgi:hypothetical protein
MEKDIGKIKKNDSTEIIVRIDDYKGKKGVTIREFVTSDRYTGFTKAGTRIPVESFIEFRDILNKIDYNDLMKSENKAVKDESAKSSVENPVEKSKVAMKKPRKKKETMIEAEEVPSEDLAKE